MALPVGHSAADKAPRSADIEQESLSETQQVVAATLSSMGFDPKVAQSAARFSSDLDRATEFALSAPPTEQPKPDNATAKHERAVAVKELPALELSDEEITKQLLVHKAVWFRDSFSLQQYCTRSHLLNSVDHHGNTPLTLALKLGFDDVVHLLLEGGADMRIPDKYGWTILQEACLHKQVQVATDICMFMVVLRAMEWEKKLPHLRERLNEAEDFYMEIDWRVESWLPFMTAMAPSDTFKLWKKGDQLRFDSTFRGMDGVNIEKGLMSFLFSGDTLQLLDHERHVAEDALAHFRNPSFERIQAEVNYMMSNDLAQNSINSDGVTFEERLSFFGNPVVEKCGPCESRVLNMQGLKFTATERKNDESDQKTAALPDFEHYFTGKGLEDEKKEQAMEDHSRSTVISKEMSATLWMADDFPLSVKNLLLILDIVSPASSDLAKLRDVVGLKLPEGFPVKLVIPILPAVSAAVTFSKFECRRPEELDDSVFAIPQHFLRR